MNPCNVSLLQRASCHSAVNFIHNEETNVMSPSNPHRPHEPI